MPGTHCTRMCQGTPEKMWDNWTLSYTLRLLSIELYVMQNPQMITMVMQLVTMETPVHMCSVYQALSPPPLEGPGYEARWEFTVITCPLKATREFMAINLSSTAMPIMMIMNQAVTSSCLL